VLVHGLLHAFVLGLRVDRDGQTHGTLGAMEKVLFAANPTDATFITVKDLLFLVVVVKQLADAAVVFAHGRVAGLTHLLDRLLLATFTADAPLHCMAIDLMTLLLVGLVLIFNRIVAKPTAKCLSTAWGNQQTASFIVFASSLPFLYVV